MRLVRESVAVAGNCSLDRFGLAATRTGIVGSAGSGDGLLAGNVRLGYEHKETSHENGRNGGRSAIAGRNLAGG